MVARGLRPAAAAGRRGADADARLRRQRRRPADPGRQPAQPDRPRPDRGGDRREDLVRRVDGHGAADLPGDVRGAGRGPAAAEQARDQAASRASQEYVAEERARDGRAVAGREEHADRVRGHGDAVDHARRVWRCSSATRPSVYETVSDRLDEGIVAVLGASLLFLLPTDWKQREFTLDWSDAAAIDWGTIVLFGTGIIFGSLLADTGLAETIGKSAPERPGARAASCAITVFAVVLAIVDLGDDQQHRLGGGRGADRHPDRAGRRVDPFVPALAATFAASFGFMLPVSTPQNAIVYGSGVVPDHEDDPFGGLLRRARRGPHHGRPADHGRGGRAGLRLPPTPGASAARPARAAPPAPSRPPGTPRGRPAPRSSRGSGAAPPAPPARCSRCAAPPRT